MTYNLHPNSTLYGKRRREEALAAYYANPVYCQNPGCGHVIEVGPKDKIYDVRRRKFCSHSCAAQFNNLGVRRNGGGADFTDRAFGICEMCGRQVAYRKMATRSYKKKPHCRSCVGVLSAIKRGQTPMGQQTKGQVVKSSSTAQLGRAKITGNARAVFWASDESKCCKVCGYERHIEVCHKRPIKDWPDEALVSEINNLMNLVALCPTHHWELDNGYLILA